MFLHGGLFHIAGNMLYLWIFGNNVEDTLGHGRFLLFYIASGAAAAATQTAVDLGSRVPMIGASGAVSGVLGAYFILFPHASVLTLVIFGFFWRLVSIPALVVLGFWMVVQILNGIGAFGTAGGVAWFAHIGGFAAGMGLLLAMRRRPPRALPVARKRRHLGVSSAILRHCDPLGRSRSSEDRLGEPAHGRRQRPAPPLLLRSFWLPVRDALRHARAGCRPEKGAGVKRSPKKRGLSAHRSRRTAPSAPPDAKAKSKERLDVTLVSRGLAPTREKARG